MSLAEDAGLDLINRFGEEITVYPQEPDQPEDTNDPIYFEEQSPTESSFTEKVRLYHRPSDEMLQEYGFESDVEVVIYSMNDSIGGGDEIEYQNQRYVVDETVTTQLGYGPYLWLHSLMGIE